jgi:hypothetical protein
MKTLIGLSLSRCAYDILEGNVELDSVKHMVTSTCAENKQIERELVDQYAVYRLGKYPPQQSIPVLEKLLSIAYQPRVHGFDHVRTNDCWLEVDIPEVFVCDDCNTIVPNKDKWSYQNHVLCKTCYNLHKKADCQYAFEQAVDKFDWGTVVMWLQDNRPLWQGEKVTIDMMQATVRMLFRDCVKSLGDKQYSRTSTGGFVVDIVNWEHSSEVRIEFPIYTTYQSY